MPADLRLQGYHENRVLTGPETVHLDVTNGCNTNCVTCWDHSPHLHQVRSALWKRQRVDADALIGVVDDVQTLGGLKAIILSGMGEPFTHPDIYRMIAGIKARGLHLTIITNLIPADAELILKHDVDQLLIGVQGASRESYQAFHPSFQSDEWERLHAMLARFQQAGKRFKHVQVICRHNAHELPEMVRLAHRYDARQVNFKLASLKDGTEAVRITQEQRRTLPIAEARALAKELKVDTNLDVFEGQVRAGGAKTADIASIGCFMGHYYSRVLVDGTVLYCCNVDVKVGKLGKFSELWNGPEWNALRQRLREGNYFDSCHQCGKLNQNVKLAQRYARAYPQ